MYKRKETHTDDVIRRFSSPHSRRSQGNQGAHGIQEEEDELAIRPQQITKLPMKLVLFLLVAGIGFLSLLYLF
ncbi:MAG: hypothetical protein AAGI48_11395 [Verrucomicrobiota bacterium]